MVQLLIPPLVDLNIVCSHCDSPTTLYCPCLATIAAVLLTQKGQAYAAKKKKKEKSSSHLHSHRQRDSRRVTEEKCKQRKESERVMEVEGGGGVQDTRWYSEKNTQW